MHNDETGLSILDKTSWLHVASTPECAYFKVTPGRSFEDIKSVGVLEGYTGRSIHDFLPAYLKFEGLEHGLCNAHHLRDFTGIEELTGQKWPGRMSELLLKTKALLKTRARKDKKPRKSEIAETSEKRDRKNQEDLPRNNRLWLRRKPGTQKETRQTRKASAGQSAQHARPALSL